MAGLRTKLLIMATQLLILFLGLGAKGIALAYFLP